MVERIQQILDDKKAQDIVLLDVRERSTVTDWIVVASGMSKPHVKALYEDVLVRLKQEGVICYRHNGEVDGGWLVLDYFHVVVHVFVPEIRAFYQIEDLWKQEPGAARQEDIAVLPQSGFGEDGEGDMDMVDEGDEADGDVRPKRRAARSGASGKGKAPAKGKTSSRPSAKSVFKAVAKRARKPAAAKTGGAKAAGVKRASRKKAEG